MTAPGSSQSRTPLRTASVARALALRVRLSRALRAGAIASAAGGIAAGAVLVLATRLPGLHPDAPLIAGAAFIAGTLAGVAWGWSRAVTLPAAAGLADTALGLDDRLTSALELAELGEPSPFTDKLIEESENAASGVVPARVVPVRPGRFWLVGLAGVLLGVGCWLWLPVPSPTQSGSSAPPRTSIAERTEASETLGSTIEALPPPADQSAADPVAAEIEAIRERLEAGDMEADDALARSAEELEQAASRSEQQADGGGEDLIAEAVQGAAEEVGGQTEELADSLASGDLARARDAARSLLSGAKEMPQEVRDRIAEDLDALADALDSAEEPPGSGPDDALTDALRERLGDLDDPQRIADELGREGVDAETARALAERIAASERQRAAKQQAREDMESLRDALERAARELEEPPAETTDPPPSNTSRDAQESVSPEKPAEDRADPASDTDDSDNGDEPDPGTGSEEQATPDPGRDQSQDGAMPDDPAERTPDPREPSDGKPSETGGDENGGREETARENTDAPSQESGQESAQDQGQQPTEDGSEQPTPDENGETKTNEEGTGSRQDQTDRSPGSEQDQGDPTAPPNSDAQKPENREGQEPGEGQQPGERQEPGEPNDQPGSQPGPQEEQPSPDGSGQGEPDGTQAQQDPTQPGQPGDTPPTGDGQNTKAGDQEGQPSENTSQRPEGMRDDASEPGGPGEGQPSPNDIDPESLERTLERLAEDQQGREALRERAEAYREQARELLEKATPEQRERWEELRRRLTDNAGTDSPPRGNEAGSQTVDARSPARGEQERVLSEWTNPDGDAADHAGSSGFGERPPGALRDAADVAEQAVEQQRVPPRYRRLVRDVFRRVRERAEQQDAAPPSPGDDARPEPVSDQGGS